MGKSVHEILQLNPNNAEQYEQLKEYIPKDIEYVTIGGKTYKNYGAFWFFWEKTLVKAPSRSANGAMTNINNISSFLTGHLVIDFSIISIDDYRSLMRTHYEQNEVVVKCYDFIYNTVAELKMYFATEERKKLYIVNRNRFNAGAWEDFLVLAGVKDYQLEMIGTNNDLDTVTITYNLNAPSNVGDTTTTIGADEVSKGGDFVCGRNIERNVVDETFNGRYRFTKWNTQKDGKGQPYIDGQAYTTNTTLVLYAQWELASELTLSYSYGLSEPMTNAKGEPIYSKLVKKGESIGALPTFNSSPSVKYNDKTYYPYQNGAWYKTPVISANSKVQNNAIYWGNTNSQIYLLYEEKTYEIDYYIDNALVSTDSVKYNNAINKLKVYKEGYVLSAWYLDREYKTPSPTVMPPLNIDLYAKWEKK